MLDEALSYLDAGLSVIPLRPGEKKPFGKWKQYQTSQIPRSAARSWWNGIVKPVAGVAIVTGYGGIVVLDVEPEHRELFEAEVNIPEGAAVAETARGGLHVYCRGESGCGKLKFEGQILGDIRGHGGFVVAPPTETPAGCYEWLTEPLPEIVPTLPEVPDWVETTDPAGSLWGVIRAPSDPPRLTAGSALPSSVLRTLQLPGGKRGLSDSELDWQICLQLAFAGWPFDRVRELYETVPRLQPRLDHPRLEGYYLEHTWSKACHLAEELIEAAPPVRCARWIGSTLDRGNSRERAAFDFFFPRERRFRGYTISIALRDGTASAEWIRMKEAMGLGEDATPADCEEREARAILRDGKIRWIV